MTARGLALALLATLALPAAAQEYAVALGKQRAAGSKIEWELRDAGHPILGDIRFAYVKNAIETPVGNAKVFSRAYVSCQKQVKRFAIELTNATAPDDPKGLKPASDPRLFCKRPAIPGDTRLVTEPLLASWTINQLGDALTRGFRAFPLRECVAIEVVQEVELPKGWAQRTAKVEFEIAPYQRELDQVFASCGEQAAYAPAPGAAATAPPPAATPPPPATAAPAAAPAATPAWRQARVLASGKTNVRGGPRLDSAVVAELAPGTPVLVQKTASEWWRARPASGPPFDGFIRQDRLDFR